MLTSGYVASGYVASFFCPSESSTRVVLPTSDNLHTRLRNADDFRRAPCKRICEKEDILDVCVRATRQGQRLPTLLLAICACRTLHCRKPRLSGETYRGARHCKCDAERLEVRKKEGRKKDGETNDDEDHCQGCHCHTTQEKKSVGQPHIEGELQAMLGSRVQETLYEPLGRLRRSVKCKQLHGVGQRVHGGYTADGAAHALELSRDRVLLCPRHMVGIYQYSLSICHMKSRV